jgi:flagellar biosynthetic protein FliQ
MTIDSAVELCRNAVMVTLAVGLPVMLSAMVVGLLISIGQAVTQLQEQTLSFVPKLVTMVLVLLYTLPWALTLLVEYTTHLYRGIPGTI